MHAKLDQVQVGGQEGSLAEAMSGASGAPSRPGSGGNRRKGRGWSLGAGGWFGVLLAFQEPKGAKKESGREQKGELATCLRYSSPFPLSCQFPPTLLVCSISCPWVSPFPTLLFLLSAVIPARSCTLQLSYLSISLPGNP